MRELWGNIAHTSGAKIYSLLVGVFSLSLTARLLGPEGRGQVATITTWVGMFSTFAYLSLGQVALHRMADDHSKTAAALRYYCWGSKAQFMPSHFSLYRSTFLFS